MNLRYKAWSPYIPLMVDGGYLCVSCRRVMIEDEWAKDSMGQCVDCWETNPVPLPLYRDLAVVKAILEKDESSGGDV